VSGPQTIRSVDGPRREKVVLVTGAGGFIGRHCLPLLNRLGYQVHVIGRNIPTGESLAHWHHADLFARDRVRDVLETVRPTHLLHLAWITTPGEYWTSPRNQDWVSASLDLSRSFIAAGGQRMTVAGSCAEYDWSYGWCREGTTPLAPSSAYGVAKLRLFVALSLLSKETGISLSWGRIFFPFGPGEDSRRLVASVCADLLAGRRANCSFGFQARDFLYVEDVAGALAALLDGPVDGPVNIGSGRPISVRELVVRLADRISSADRVDFGARRSADEDIPLVAADIGRLRNVVGWRPTFSLEEALGRTVGWWRAGTLHETANELASAG